MSDEGPKVELGARFGRWTVTDMNPPESTPSKRVIAATCDCGTRRVMRPSRLTGAHCTRQCKKCAHKASKRSGFGRNIARTVVPGDHV